MVVLWTAWGSRTLELSALILSFLQALPFAVLAVYLLPALACVLGTIVWEVLSAVFEKPQDPQS
jgi:ABC-type methionine transport system permease subunit